MQGLRPHVQRYIQHHLSLPQNWEIFRDIVKKCARTMTNRDWAGRATSAKSNDCGSLNQLPHDTSALHPIPAHHAYAFGIAHGIIHAITHSFKLGGWYFLPYREPTAK
jgi:hypothetical protein